MFGILDVVRSVSSVFMGTFGSRFSAGTDLRGARRELLFSSFGCCELAGQGRVVDGSSFGVILIIFSDWRWARNVANCRFLCFVL